MRRGVAVLPLLRQVQGNAEPMAAVPRPKQLRWLVRRRSGSGSRAADSCLVGRSTSAVLKERRGPPNQDQSRRRLAKSNSSLAAGPRTLANIFSTRRPVKRWMHTSRLMTLCGSSSGRSEGAAVFAGCGRAARSGRAPRNRGGWPGRDPTTCRLRVERTGRRRRPWCWARRRRSWSPT